MTDTLAAALATEGIGWLLGAIFVAGMVFGFSGFGAALVFQPLAAIFVAPSVGIAILSVASFGAAAMLFPRALPQADLRQAAWMTLPAVLCLPPGVWVLVHADVTALRWVISALVSATLGVLLTGWRREVAARPATLAAIGAGAGGIGGATGLHGPVVILFTLAGTATPQLMRATMLIVLTSLGMAMLPVMGAMGHVPPDVLWLGVIATPAYLLGVAIGQAAFDPRHARLWRWLGYGVVAGSVVAGLPVWT